MLHLYHLSGISVLCLGVVTDPCVVDAVSAECGVFSLSLQVLANVSSVGCFFSPSNFFMKAKKKKKLEVNCY